MLDAIKTFFSSGITDDPQEDNISLAVAALLVEIMIADHQVDTSELLAIKGFLTEFLDLPDNQIDEIIQLAQQSSESSHDIYQFTRTINDQFDYQKRCQLVKGLWQLAYADKKIDKYEEYTVRKISDLLYIKQKDFIQAKLAAKP